MYRGRLRNNSGLSNGNGVRKRLVDRLSENFMSSTPKENGSDIVSLGDEAGIADSNYQLELYSPSTMTNATPVPLNRFRYSDKYSYAYDSAYEAVYSEKLIVHTIENIVDKEPVVKATAFGYRSQHGGGRRRRRWWPWILLPLLLLLPLLWFGSSDGVRRSLCSFFGPLPISAANKTLEVITMKKFYHFFVPSQAQKSTSNLEDMRKFEDLLTAVDSRLEMMEDAFKRINASTGAANQSTSAKNYTKDISSLRVLFSNLDQRIGDLEAASISSDSNRKSLNEDIAAVRSQLTRLRQNLESMENDQKSWRDQLNDVVAKSRQQQLELAEISSKLDSVSKSDCDCSPAVVPEGTINKHEVDRLIMEAIRRYDADKTGLPDYALEPAGGTVLSTRCTETYPSNTREHTLWGFRIPFLPRDYSPRTVIQPGLTPGECWAFKGAGGYLVIKLSGLIQVTAVSYEHIPKEISPDGNIFSAPKNMEVFALSSEMDQNGTLLGTFTYNADGTPLQYFPVQVQNASPTEILELRIKSNHGHPLYTCLYRFRVHGKRMNPGWPSFGGS